MNDNFVKNKFIEIVSTEYKELAFNVTFLEPCRTMIADELFGYFVAHDDMIAKANRTKEIVRAMNKNPSLALKAKATQPKVNEASKEERVEEDQEEEEEMTSTSELDTDLAFFAKKYGKHSMKKWSFVPKNKRISCYNCDELGHFSDTCPYEKRLDKLKYAKGVRPKLKSNPINLRNKNKFKDVKALVGVEYTSDVDEEDSDEEDVVGVAGLALAKPRSLFKYDYTKDYEGSSKNTPHKFLMAKEAKVTSPSQPSCPINDDMDEDAIPSTLYKTMCSLRGDACAHFEYLMDTIALHNESLDEARSHIEDGYRRFNLLAQELTEEKNTSLLLSQQLKTYQLDRIKDMDTLDKTLTMAKELDASKKELEVAHACLTKDLEHLERDNKLVKDELNRLSKKYEELQAIHEEVQGSSSMPINVENIACDTNYSLDQATLIEENAKLKAQLEKEHLTSPQLGKPPHELFAQQKVRLVVKVLGSTQRRTTTMPFHPRRSIL
jgi:hypothetical protein